MPKREMRPFVFLALAGDTAGKRFSGASSPPRPFPSCRTTDQPRCDFIRLFSPSSLLDALACASSRPLGKKNQIHPASDARNVTVSQIMSRERMLARYTKIGTRWRHKRKKHEDASPL